MDANLQAEIEAFLYFELEGRDGRDSDEGGMTTGGNEEIGNAITENDKYLVIPAVGCKIGDGQNE
eukprot:12369752-Ditylum_brightwellii.AAC.1